MIWYVQQISLKLCLRLQYVTSETHTSLYIVTHNDFVVLLIVVVNCVLSRFHHFICHFSAFRSQNILPQFDLFGLDCGQHFNCLIEKCARFKACIVVWLNWCLWYLMNTTTKLFKLMFGFQYLQKPEINSVTEKYKVKIFDSRVLLKSATHCKRHVVMGAKSRYLEGDKYLRSVVRNMKRGTRWECEGPQKNNCILSKMSRFFNLVNNIDRFPPATFSLILFAGGQLGPDKSLKLYLGYLDLKF